MLATTFVEATATLDDVISANVPHLLSHHRRCRKNSRSLEIKEKKHLKLYFHEAMVKVVKTEESQLAGFKKSNIS